MKYKIQLWVLPFIGSTVVAACSKDAGLPGAPATGTKNGGAVAGIVTDAKNLPVKGAGITIEHTVWYNSYLLAASNNEGKYEVSLPNEPAGDWTAKAQLTKNAYGQTYTFDLEGKPSLEKNKDVIIIMTSNHAYSSIPGCFPYNIAKTALTGLVRSLAIEWGPAIRTVGIAPGFIDTPGNQQWFDSFADANAERQRTIDAHPVKKLGTIEEIGGWCVFLASDYAAFASGTTYLVDGGRSALMQD